MSRLNGDDPPAEQFSDFYRRVWDQITELWPKCVNLGVSVVLDLGFWSRAQRDEVRQTAERLGASTRLYALACSDEVAWARIEQRNKALSGSLFISRPAFELLKARFEPLTDDEDAIFPKVIAQT